MGFMAPTYDLRASTERRDVATARRLDQIIPSLMDEHDIDCWVLISREYADDPIVMSMLPADWFSSRRRTVLVFIRTTSGVERFSVSRYETDGLFEVVWDPSKEPDQFDALARLLREHSPATIAVNTSSDFAHADGLTASEHAALTRGLGDLSGRIVPAGALAVNWLETRIPEERGVMEEACAIAHSLLRRALSPEVITPGQTTTDDVVWWLRGAVQDVGVTVWFQPTVSVQRESGDLRGSFAGRPGPELIQSGDLIHIDFGIVWDGLCTDQQQHGYVLPLGQTDVPDWLVDAMAAANRAQDILLSTFSVGLTGNEVLADTLEQASSEGIRATVYTHPIGFQGHGAGPTIGLWDQQDGVPGSGDMRMRADTAWSIELNVEAPNTPWGDQVVRIMLEEDAWFDGETVDFLDGRQTGIWPI